MLEYELLTQALAKIPQEDYPTHSRVHKLNVGKEHKHDCYVKREDELGCLLSGSKVRKYRSLVAALKSKGYKKVGLIGSQFSNHVLGLSSLLLENSIEPMLFLLEAKNPPLAGNALFIQLFVPKNNIQLIPRESWNQAYEIASCWQIANGDNQSCIVPEGGSLQDSVAGLTTLALDIIQNEKQTNLIFNDILIDSGTGLTAASLIATYGLLKKTAHIHVMLAAATPDAFKDKLAEVKQALEYLTGMQISSLPQYSIHRPPCAKSFGSTNANIFQTIKSTAQSEGFLLDPIYSSKLFLLLNKLIETKSLSGPTLFIHSGGLFSLAGFQSQLGTH